MDMGVKKSGGEGGIRTLGTGFSPYNGLAILCSDRTPRNLDCLRSRFRTKPHPERPQKSFTGHRLRVRRRIGCSAEFRLSLS